MKRTIVGKDFIKWHPHIKDDSTNLSYARFANQLIKIIEGHISDKSPKEIVEIACTIALYMEDIVGELGVWQSFITLHKQLYGRYLPFFEVNEETYFINEPNIEDIQFLVWKTLSADPTHIVHPVNPYIYELSKDLFDYCEERFELLPIHEASQPLLRYLFEHNMLPNICFPYLEGDATPAHQLVAENWDFLARFLKGNDYEA